MKAQMQKGFTLIELMIVVAIIGILAAVALPAYSDYQAKSKFTAGMSEISAGKTAFELKMNDGEAIANASDIGLAGSTSNCSITATGTAGGTGTIECQIIKAPTQVIGKKITLTRNASGNWSCNSDLAGDAITKFAPTSCRG